ncbi:MAG: squalene cyclase, partial [Actinomycetales bacterium]|nr:squalene cyclase [Actinomycetales bacterium]
DGGWNCEWVEGSTVSSFHSTLNSLKGLLDLERTGGATDATRAARHAGEEYLLRRGLFRRLATGEPVGPWVDRFVYPWRHRYSVLNALDYFRAASELDGPKHDPRMTDAVEMVRAQRQPDGRWLQSTPLAGRVWFAIDVPEGEPSPWLTFFATRALAWWDTR